MAVSITCPNCGAKLKAPDELVGKQVKCPKCQKVFVPGVAAQPPPIALVEQAPPPTPPAHPQQQIPARAALLQMPQRQCFQCGFQGHMPKKWDSWVVPVAIVAGISTCGLGLLILLVPKKHRCPQCGAIFE